LLREVLLQTTFTTCRSDPEDSEPIPLSLLNQGSSRCNHSAFAKAVFSVEIYGIASQKWESIIEVARFDRSLLVITP
jgi:hypothetical protein